MNDFKKANFANDAEKMRDFHRLTKEEFLQSYSYLTEEEYDNTLELVKGNAPTECRTTYVTVRIDYDCPVGMDDDEAFGIALGLAIQSNYHTTENSVSIDNVEICGTTEGCLG